MMIVSQVGIDLIKQYEGLVLHAYKAVKTEKYFTIGYGHYGVDVRENSVINQSEAEQYLKMDLKKFENGVNESVKVSLNQNQYDSLVSLAYNIGVTGFKTSDLVNKLNHADYKGASNEFDRWVHSKGKVLKGLVVRRAKEKELFLKDYKEYTDRVSIHNTAFWQANSLINEFKSRGFKCYGIPVDVNHQNDHDGCKFVLETDMKKASLVCIELKQRGYSSTIWETINRMK
jgi:GH24 family phage-related lysozyme (muramidase)